MFFLEIPPAFVAGGKIALFNFFYWHPNLNVAFRFRLPMINCYPSLSVNILSKGNLNCPIICAIYNRVFLQ